MTTHKIFVLRSSPVAFYAASELARCLRQMADPAVSFEICGDCAGPELAAPGIVIALAGDARLAKFGVTLPPSPLDDAVAVDIRQGCGMIVGANERSLLIAVYRFLHHLGCRWVRPGAAGESIPRQDIYQANVNFIEHASLRHRVLCIEGAVSLQHVLDLIDWAPKVGFSGYFMQFTDGFTFFQRWYAHASNPDRLPEPFTAQAARAFTVRIEAELARRGLHYHAVGHGWTCQALGARISHWNPVSLPLNAETRGMLAQINGQRVLRWDRPMITSLCFSQPEVRQRMIGAIVKHALVNPQVDQLHVWLDDGGNNKCECDACSQRRPSDDYLQLLHELDASLTAVASPMRIVFIAYSDLLWPPAPETARLNPERFVFLYANGRASYRETLAVEGDSEIPPYVRNQPADVCRPDRFRGFLKGWREFFPVGDAILFEYYMNNQGGVHHPYQLSSVIHADIAKLKQLGFNGLISCQPQRAFFPVGLACYVMGQSLWNADQDLDLLRDDYFSTCFGQDGGAAKEFLKVSSETLDKAVQFTNKICLTADAPAQLLKLESLIDEFKRIAAGHSAEPDLCQAQSWQYLAVYVQLLGQLVELFKVIATGKPAAVLAKWQQVRSFITAQEEQCHAAFDVWDYLRPLDNYLINGQFSSDPTAVVQ